ncbi:hypothetical protein DPMN_010718, partial [Dreissena polymorpha]
YTKEEIDSKVALFRKMLMDKEGVQEGSSVEKDEFGRPIAKQTHQIAEATAEKNARLKEAFGISDYYQDGSSFDPNRKAKEEAAKALAMAHKKYAIVQDSDSASETSPSPSPQKQKKKSRDKSESVERKSSKKKKSKKHRNDRSESRKSKKRKNKHKKRDSGEKRKKHKRHTSPSSDSESSTDDDKKGSGESEEEEASQPHKSPEKVREQVLKSGSAERRPRQEVKGRSGSLSSLASSPSPFSTTDPQSLAWTGSGSNKHIRDSRSPKKTRSRSDSRGRRGSKHDKSDSDSKSRSRERESRSPSIRRRKGSPSHLDRRRITRSGSPEYRQGSSARKRPVPYPPPHPAPLEFMKARMTTTPPTIATAIPTAQPCGGDLPTDTATIDIVIALTGRIVTDE